ncbi:putative membrane protein [Glaciihabitans tibetensis]|uniref:Putative membrane protein n=1 Tax=Glaciihabitans tibetensis TaxID=1266600 RepID=A0A2T0VFJ5_9MICO|nr:DUF998 domain-containing protein [Glaciihabitans tibetensis]PRY68979.1 putative membrane protein [Glaciihabitans tibetensis]
MTRFSTRRVLGALAFILSGIQYVGLEAIAASAWKNPPYDYLANYISDLGVSQAQIYDGRDVNSPLAWVMNTGFVLEGLLFLAGALLLADLFVGRRRALFVSFAILHAVGIVLVGFFDETSTVSLAHVGGAYLSIVFGNLVALVAGLSWKCLKLPRWFGVVSVALPVLGLLSEGMLLLSLTGESLDGLWERGGVYSITAWQILFGTTVLASLRRLR